MNQLASFSVPEPRTLVIQPFDKGAMAAMEKAIMQSDLGLTPSNDGNVIRLAFPAADRGTSQGADQGRASARGGGQGRGAKRSHATSRKSSSG